MNLQTELRNSLTPAPSGDVLPIENAKDFPSFVYCRHMQPGLVGYANERVLVDADAIKRMLPSLNGRPIYLNHQDVDLATMKQKAAGYVVDAFYNELDGWGWAKLMLTDDEAKEAVKSGWRVSNAYVPTDWAGKGLNNNVEYDRAILNGKFTHLALVRDPRYEQAQIFTPEAFNAYQSEKRQQLSTLRNSKTEPTGKERKMGLNFFTRKKEAVTAVDADTVVEITNDKGEVSEMAIGDMVKALENAKPAAPAPAAEAPKADELANSKVKVGDKEMTVAELVAAHTALQNAKPAAEAAPAAPAAPAAAEPKVDHFKELSNANQPAQVITTVDTTLSKVQRGKNRYGSGE